MPLKSGAVPPKRGGGPSTSTLPCSKWRSQKGEYTQLPVSSTACASGPGQKGGDRFPVLDTLKFLAVLQIVASYYFTNAPSGWVKRFHHWGNAPLSFLFLLSGFLLACRYGRRDGREIEVWPFLVRRWARMYPLYLTSIVAGLWMLPGGSPVPLGLLGVLLLCLSGFVPSALANSVNSPCWTVGAFLLLYLLFPYSLRLLQATSGRQRVLLLPSLSLLSIVRPLLEMGYSFGILTPFVRVAATISLADFWQGMVLGLLFLSHDWTAHPMWLQRGGMTLPLLLLLLLPLALDGHSQTSNVLQLWLCHGLLCPLSLCVLWYGARGRDMLNGLLSWGPSTYLGSIAYAMYLLQQPVLGSMWGSEASLSPPVSPSALPSLAALIGLSALATYAMQNPYVPTFLHCARPRASPPPTDDGPSKPAPPTKPPPQSIKPASGKGRAMGPWAAAVRAGVAFKLAVAYALYVNWQACVVLPCHSRAGGSPLPSPPLLSAKQWPNAVDWAWLVSSYSIPCNPTYLLRPSYVRGLECCALVLACVALGLRLVWRLSVFHSLRQTPPSSRATHDGGAVSQVMLYAVEAAGSAGTQSEDMARLRDLATQVVCVEGGGLTVGVKRLACPDKGRGVTVLTDESDDEEGGPGSERINVYVSGETRLSASDVVWLSSHGAPPPRALTLLHPQLEGSASVVPTVATLADLCYHCHSGSGSNYHGDTISSSRNGETGQGEEGHMGPAVLVARHGCILGLSTDVIRSTVQTGLLPTACHIPVHKSGMLGSYTPHSLACVGLRRHAHARKAWHKHGIAGLCGKPLCRGLLHLSFVLATLCLLASPVHESYAHTGQDTGHGWGYGCGGGWVGWGVRPMRLLMTLLAAGYTGLCIWCLLCVTASSPLEPPGQDNGGRLGRWVGRVFVFVLMLALLPLTALWDGVTTLTAVCHTIHSALGLPSLRVGPSDDLCEDGRMWPWSLFPFHAIGAKGGDAAEREEVQSLLGKERSREAARTTRYATL